MHERNQETTSLDVMFHDFLEAPRHLLEPFNTRTDSLELPQDQKQ